MEVASLEVLPYLEVRPSSLEVHPSYLEVEVPYLAAFQEVPSPAALAFQVALASSYLAALDLAAYLAFLEVQQYREVHLRLVLLFHQMDQ